MKALALVVLSSMLFAVSCGRARPSAATIEVQSVRENFPMLAAWVESNRQDLAAMVLDIQQQDSLQRVFWSRPPEYFTALFRDGSILQGNPDGNSWPEEKKLVVKQWVSRLTEAGCHGFDDQGTNWACRLFLDVNVYIGIPASSNTRLVEQYESWAVNGRDFRGDACTNLNGGWYLCTERR